MRPTAILVTSFCAASLMVASCSGSIDRTTSPTAVTPDEALGSGPPTTRTPPPPQSPLPPPSGTCNAINAQSAIGEPASKEVLERARVAAQATTARFIRPNEPITTELLGSRLNLQLDERDVVRAVSCG